MGRFLSRKVNASRKTWQQGTTLEMPAIESVPTLAALSSVERLVASPTDSCLIYIVVGRDALVVCAFLPAIFGYVLL